MERPAKPGRFLFLEDKCIRIAFSCAAAIPQVCNQFPASAVNNLSKALLIHNVVINSPRIISFLL